MRHEDLHTPLSWGPVVLIMALGLAVASALAYVVGAWAPMPRLDRALLSAMVLFAAWPLAVLVLGVRTISTRRLAPRPRQRLRPRLFRLHVQLGGLLAFFVLAICCSGSAAIAARTLTAWEQAPLVELDAPVPATADQPLDEIVNAALAEHPQLSRGRLRITPATAETPWIRLAARGGGLEFVRDYDPLSAAPLAEGRGPLHAAVQFHRSLFLPAVVGQTLVTSLGVLLIVVLLCGLATRRRWSRELIRLRAHVWRAEAHKLIGIWTFVFGVGLAFTGALAGGTALSVPTMTASAYEGDRDALFHDVLAVDPVPLRPTALPRPPLPSLLDPQCIDDGQPPRAWSVEDITLRHPGLASARTTVQFHGPGPWLDEAVVVFDAHGTAVDCRVLPKQQASLQLFYGLVALHFADFGGGAQWLVELGWIIVGLALAAGAWVGEHVRQRKLQRAGQPPGRWAQGALVGWGLGMPLGFTALLLLSRACPVVARADAVAPLVFATVWATTWLVASLRPSGLRHTTIARGCVTILALCLLATALLSVVLQIATGIDLLWACLGMMLLGSLRWRKLRARTEGASP